MESRYRIDDKVYIGAAARLAAGRHHLWGCGWPYIAPDMVKHGSKRVKKGQKLETNGSKVI